MATALSIVISDTSGCVIPKDSGSLRYPAQAPQDSFLPQMRLGCGTGRITMALAQMGKRVTGLDLSERMLERAARKRAALNKEERERVHLVQADMAQFDLGEKFQLVIIPFRPVSALAGSARPGRLPGTCSQASAARRPPDPGRVPNRCTTHPRPGAHARIAAR